MSADETPVFFYGTLRDPELCEIVLGRACALTPARLAGQAVRVVVGEDYPILVPSPGSCEGVVAHVTEAELARLDFYERPFGYDLSTFEVDQGGATIAAQAYTPQDHLVPGAVFDLAHWQAQFGPLIRRAAHEYMAKFGLWSDAQAAQRMPVIQARAHAELSAKAHPSSRNLRFNSDPQALEVVEQTEAYSAFFALDELRLRVPRYAGGLGPEVSREVFVMVDSISVLPYDPVRDVVLLIEQFRPGIWRRGDPFPWSLEAVAGRQDPGESPEQTARREAREEADVELGALHVVGRYYTSPGASTEYLTSFVGICALPDPVERIGGLDSEAEDIRAFTVRFDTFMEALDSGELENGPLVLTAHWLARHRDRLRAESPSGQ